MEHYATLHATLKSFAAGAETFLMIVAAGLILYAVMVAAVLRKIEAWGRSMEKSAAMWERECQEHKISLAIDSRRREEEHARWMKALNARRR